MSVLRMLISIVFYCGLMTSVYGMQKPEDEQELLFHESDYDFDYILDRLGFQKEKAVYCNIGMPGIDGQNPLQRAVMWGDVDATKQLVGHPAFALNRERRCWCIHRAMLNQAVFARDVKRVEELRKSPVLCLNEKERHAVLIRVIFFSALLSLGFPEKSRVFFDINASDHETGDCPLFRAILRNDFEIIQALLTFDDLNLNRSDKYGTTALIHAIIYKLDDVLKLLIHDDRPRILNGYYLDINCADCFGLTPLMWAIKVNNELAIDWLCADRRLDPQRIDNKGRSALDWACKAENHYAFEKINALIPKVMQRTARSSGSQTLRTSIPSPPQYETPYSPRSLAEVVLQSPRLSIMMPSLSLSELPSP